MGRCLFLWPRRRASEPKRPANAHVIRITTTQKESVTTVKADGRLLSADTAELIRACDVCPAPLVIDLSDLTFADDEGAEVLKKLRAGGATLVGARPYVAMVVKEERE